MQYSIKYIKSLVVHSFLFFEGSTKGFFILKNLGEKLQYWQKFLKNILRLFT